jgi:hypothetical protein
MDDNENPHREFGKCCYHLCKVQEISTELTCTDFTIWRLLPTPHCQAWAECGRPCGVLSFTNHSLCHFHTHNSRVVWLWASCLWNCCQKPRCVTVTASVLINNSTIAIWCCNDQHSIATKLHTSLYMTVIVEALCSEHIGFQIPKTIRCFWLTAIFPQLQ